MGLDAVVYKHRSKLPLDPERAGLRIEPNTREWYTESGDLPEAIKLAGVEALHRRLGNVSSIASLYAHVALLLPADSVLLSKVLCDGAHAGDLLSLERVGALKREISNLRNGHSPLSPEVASLLNSLDALVEAAEANHNPIVFV
jgi:hypothetical protein